MCVKVAAEIISPLATEDTFCFSLVLLFFEHLGEQCQLPLECFEGSQTPQEAKERILVFCLSFSPLKQQLRQIRKSALHLILEMQSISEKLLKVLRNALNDQDRDMRLNFIQLISEKFLQTISSRMAPTHVLTSLLEEACNKYELEKDIEIVKALLSLKVLKHNQTADPVQA